MSNLQDERAKRLAASPGDVYVNLNRAAGERDQREYANRGRTWFPKRETAMHPTSARFYQRWQGAS